MGYASDQFGLHLQLLVGVLLLAIALIWVALRRKAIAAALEPAPEAA